MTTTPIVIRNFFLRLVHLMSLSLLPKLETNWNPLKTKSLPHLIDQIPLIRKMDPFRKIRINHKSGWTSRNLSNIVQFHTSISIKRRRVDAPPTVQSAYSTGEVGILFFVCSATSSTISRILGTLCPVKAEMKRMGA